MITEFESWVYKGLIAIAVFIISYLWQRRDKSNDETIKELKTSLAQMQKTIKELNNTIIILNATLKTQQKICNLRHNIKDEGE